MAWHIVIEDVVLKRASCECGWDGPLRDSHYDAEEDSRLHWKQHSKEWADLNAEWEKAEGDS